MDGQVQSSEKGLVIIILAIASSYKEHSCIATDIDTHIAITP